MISFHGRHSAALKIKPTVDYQINYIQYEEVVRLHPHWPLADIRAMTSRQRKHWIAVGKVRLETKRRETQSAMSNGGVWVGP